MSQHTTQRRLAMEQVIKSVHIIAILSFITALISESSVTSIGANDVEQQQQQQQQHQALGTSLPRPDPNGRPQLMVAIYCGGQTSRDGRSSSSLYHNQYLEIESRKWRSDRDASAFCTRDKQAILNYCKKVYPDHDIRNIVESSRAYKIDNWCRLGSSKRKCRARLTTRPYRCLEGTFQSDALLVPERCVFDHVHNKSVCINSESWNKSAADICHSKSMKLQSYGMLQPCGLDVFSGVEFVCCPPTATAAAAAGDIAGNKATGKTEGSGSIAESSNSFAQAATALLPASMRAKEPKYETENEQSNNINTDEDNGGAKKQHRSDNQSEHDDENDDDEDEYDEDDEDGYDDDSTSWNGDRASSASSTSTTTTTTTTTTTERPIERYLSHFDLAHEHDDYRRAELSIEGSYRDKITHVMREWSQLDTRYEEMKKKDVQAAEEFKRKMTDQFQKTVEALEQESAAQRHQLASMHAERAMAIINRRKKVAMDCLTQALDRIPIRTRPVERCIVRLLKALEKDRAHTLRQYKNLLNLNTREALHERKIILDHLVTLNRAANQSIAMLDRSPILIEKLKGRIVALWHKLRNVPLNEPIVVESEEKIMDQYEEEAAQRKIERERKRLAEQEAHQQRQESTTARSSPVENATPVKSEPHIDSRDAAQSTASKPVDTLESSTSATSAAIAAQQKPQEITGELQSSQNTPSAARLVGDINEKDRTHYQTDSVGFSHLRLEAPYHELSYASIKHEPLQGHMRFGASTLLISSLAVVVLIAFIGVKYYGRNSSRAYRRQGFAEVGRSCPEEKTVSHMQFNGYENPAYKFFEAEA